MCRLHRMFPYAENKKIGSKEKLIMPKEKQYICRYPSYPEVTVQLLFWWLSMKKTIQPFIYDLQKNFWRIDTSGRCCRRVRILPPQAPPASPGTGRCQCTATFTKICFKRTNWIKITNDTWLPFGLQRFVLLILWAVNVQHEKRYYYDITDFTIRIWRLTT